MIKTLSTALFLALITSIHAQQAVYNIPQTVRTEQAELVFQKVKSSSSSYFINYKAENTGDGVLVIDRSKASLIAEGGELHPRKEKYVLKSGETKTIYNEFKIQAPVKANADKLELQLYGIQYAMGTGTALTSDKLVLAEKAEQSVGDFKIKVMEYNVYSDRVFAEVKCTYDGGTKRMGKIDLSKITVNGGEAKIVKKGDVLFSGKSYTFAINIAPNGDEVNIDWTGVLHVLNLVNVNMEKITITSTTYKEPKEPGEVEVVEGVVVSDPQVVKPVAKPTESCALSYNEFVALKTDLESEVNSGGKPVAMANELLMVKGCINTAQVAELMGIFNLDAPRLEFAKMAYQFTSDKNKYHLAVGKLSYNKNKEALEEFLGQQ